MVEETLGGLRIIKAFNAERKIQSRFERSNETFREITNKVYRRQQMAHPMSEFLGTATIAIVLWYGGSLILSANSPIDAPTFIYYLVIFYSIINPAKDLSKSVYAIQKGLASMERVDKILKAEVGIKEKENPIHVSSFEHDIEFRHVGFKYDPAQKALMMRSPPSVSSTWLMVSLHSACAFIDLALSLRPT